MGPTDLNTNKTTADTELSFIPNDETLSLKERFEVLIRNISFFDCLVGYFYASDFHSLYKSLEDTEKIRILIGISTNRQTFDMLEQANRERQAELQFSHA